MTFGAKKSDRVRQRKERWEKVKGSMGNKWNQQVKKKRKYWDIYGRYKRKANEERSRKV